MGKGFKNGGSNPLNFKVKTYPSETELKADKPRENTIGVITTTTMTSWAFLAKEPTEPEVGMVWFSYNYSSNAAFNALKKNTLQVYPISAKQYVGGKWEVKVAYSYQRGEWKAWWGGELFKDGDQYTDYTGGWEAKAMATNANNTGKAPTLSITNTMNLIHSQTDNKGYGGIVISKNKIDVSAYKTLTIKCPVIKLTGMSYYATEVSMRLLSSNDSSLGQDDVTVASKVLKSATQASMSHTNVSDSLDISNCNGEYFVAICYKVGGKHGTADVNLTVNISELLLS